MKHIRLTQVAYLCGSDGDFFRFNDEHGDELAQGICNYWYEARAKDDAGEEYTVIWEIIDQESLENADEEHTVIWAYPTYIEDDNGCNVTDDLILVWKHRTSR